MASVCEMTLGGQYLPDVFTIDFCVTASLLLGICWNIDGVYLPGEFTLLREMEGESPPSKSS